MTSMNGSQLTALIGALAALVTAVGGVVALFVHTRNPDGHAAPPSTTDTPKGSSS